MRKIWTAFDKFEESVMAAGMLLMVALNFLNVVCRYLLPQTPFSYTEELVMLIFVWVSMFGISYGYRQASHTVLTLLYDCLSIKWRLLVVIFSTTASAVFMLFFTKTGYGMVMNQLKFGQILPGMRIPVAVVGWAIPVGAAVTFVSILKSGADEIAQIWLGLKKMTGEGAARS